MAYLAQVSFYKPFYLAMTLKIGSRSNLMASLDSPYVVSYSLLIYLYGLSCSDKLVQTIFPGCDLANEVKVKFKCIIRFSIRGFWFIANTFIRPSHLNGQGHEVKVKGQGQIGWCHWILYMWYLYDLTCSDKLLPTIFLGCDLENEVKVKFDSVIGFSICGFLFIANTFILPSYKNCQGHEVKVKGQGQIWWCHWILYMWHLYGLSCSDKLLQTIFPGHDLVNEVKVKSDGIIRFSICGFLFIANTFIWPSHIKGQGHELKVKGQGQIWWCHWILHMWQSYGLAI